MYDIPRLSFEGRLGTRLERWQMSAESFVLLANSIGVKVGKTRLAGAVSGREAALPVQLALELEPLIGELDSLVEIVSPLVLNFTNPVLVHSWLKARRRGELEISVKQIGVSHE
jgi:hypothetical protein